MRQLETFTFAPPIGKVLDGRGEEYVGCVDALYVEIVPNTNWAAETT